MEAKQSDAVQKKPTTEVVRKQPNVDTRIKTEDVTDRKGLEFKDFNLGEDLMLVSENLHLTNFRVSTKWVSSSPPQSKRKPFPNPSKVETSSPRPKTVLARQQLIRSP
jgi:hypothetical protein